VNVYRLQHRLFAGGWNAPIVRELFERGHAAALLPYDPVRDEIVLVEQFRIGAMETSATPGCWSWWPASSMKGRPPKAVVRREAVEEAGIEVDAANTPSAIW
jgi:ADP-ribose pyrophosphatase